MPALPTVVSDYLTSVKSSLTTGTDFADVGLHGAAKNFLSAMDMANVLILLQDAMTPTATFLASAGGTTTTMTFAAATFTAGDLVGNTATFEADTTTVALQGVSAKIVSNTATSITFDTILPAATATGDEIAIRATFLDDKIAELNGSGALGDAPAANPYGLERTAVDALTTLLFRAGGTVGASSTYFATTVNGDDATTTEIPVHLKGNPLLPGQFKGSHLVIGGVSRRIVDSTVAGVFTVAPGFASAPTDTTAVTVVELMNDITVHVTNHVHPGGQPGRNAFLADFIDQAQTAVVAYTLPS